MSIEWLISAFTTLFVIVDPLGLVPIFLVLTQGASSADRRAIALRAALTAMAILTTFTLIGASLLDALGITLPAFRIAGGLLLFWTAFEMIYEKRVERKKEAATNSLSKDDIKALSVFPLAIPLMAGPGAISAAVLLSSSQSTYMGYAALVGIIAVIMLLCFIAFVLAEKLDKLLGEAGRILLGRLLGVLLAALSVQFVADGVIELMGRT